MYDGKLDKYFALKIIKNENEAEIKNNLYESYLGWQMGRNKEIFSNVV